MFQVSSMQEWLARLRPWLNALLVFVLLLPLARLSWRLVVPAEPEIAATVAETSAPVSTVQRKPVEVTALREALLFGQPSGASLNGELPETSLSIKLQGVIAAGESPSAVAVFDSGEPKLRAVRVGMAIQPEVILKAVYKDRAVISNHGRDEKISLQTPPAMNLIAPPPPVSAPTSYPPGIEAVDGSPPGFVPQPMGGPVSQVPGQVPNNATTGEPPGGFRAYGGSSAPPSGAPAYQPPQHR